jgi:hypothetical protein
MYDDQILTGDAIYDLLNHDFAAEEDLPLIASEWAQTRVRTASKASISNLSRI